MADIKITDLVDPEEIRKLQELDAELKNVLATYTKVAKDLAQGLEVDIKVAGDIDKLEKLLTVKGKEAVEVQQKLTEVMQEQSQVVANTTNTISRQLMEQERVNKTTRAAYTEQERVKKLLDQYHDTYEGQLESLVKINRELEQNKKAQKDNERALSMGRISLAGFSAKQAELIAQYRSLSQAKKTLTQLMTAEEKAAQSQEGSYVHLSQQLELLKKAYKDLSEEGRDSDFGKELEETIQNLDAHLKDMAADMGEFQRNVGNYAVANNDLKKKYDELVGTLAALQSAYGKMSEADKASAEGKKLAASINEVSTAAKNTKKTLDEQTATVEDARRSLGETGGTTSSVKRDLKELVLEIANLTIEYQNLSEEEKNSAEGQELAEHIRDLTEKAGVLKDAIADTNAAITNAASDTRGFDQVGGALQLAIDGFGLAAGAAEILGISEGELAEIQTKLQAAIAASNAMTKIQNALQKQSAVMQGVANLQTKAGAIAIKLKTAAEGKGVVTTKLLTAAQWLFNKAAAANPIGLLVVAIVACIAAVAGLIKIFNVFGSDTEKRKEQLKQEAEVLDGLGKVYEQNTERMKAMGRSDAEVIASSIAGLKRLSDAWTQHYYSILELYDTDADEYKEALEKKNEADEKFRDKLEEANNVMIKMFAEEGEQQIADEMERVGALHTYKVTKINQEMQKWKELYKLVHTLDGTWTQAAQDTFDQRMDAIAQRRINKVNEEEEKEAEDARKKAADAAKKRQDEAAKAAEQLRKEVQAGEDALLKIIIDNLERQRQAEILSYNRKLKELQDRLAKTKDTEVQLRTALSNQIEGLTAEHNQKLQDIEFAFAERRLKTESDLISSHLSYVKEGSQEEFDWTLKSLDNQYAAELLTIQKAEAAETLTSEQAEEMRLNIERKFQKLRLDAENDFAKKQLDAIQKRYADQEETSNTAMIVELNKIKTQYAAKLAAAKGDTAAQIRLKEQFEQESADIQQRYAIQTAKSAVALIEEELKTENLSAEERANLTRQLAQAKAQLEQQMADAAIANIERVNEKDAKSKEQRMKNAQQWLQIAADSLNSINDLVSTIYDAKIAKVEEEQEANTEAGEAEQERIAQMVEQNVITEEEGEARKRAAEDKTAKKNEELEKKKAKLKEKQAKFDKLNSIAQVGISTALAIMNMMESAPWPVNIAMAAVAGAMGAVQLATIIATPLPKYAKGTGYHKGGPAIVGDGGVPEVITYGGNAWITPDEPMLVDLPTGASVIPDVSRLDESELAVARPLMQCSYDAPKTYNDAKVLDRLDNLIFIEKSKSRTRRLSDINSQLAHYLLNKDV